MSIKLFFSIFLILISSCKAEVSSKTSALKLLGYVEISNQTSVDKLPFGGLSGMIAINDKTYMAISDDRSEFGPARMIKLEIDFKDNKLIVNPLENISLKENGETYKLNTIDGEAITKIGDHYAIASEGSYRADLRSAPFIKIFNKNGDYLETIEINEERFVPEPVGTMTKGVRSNLGFESLSLSPSQNYLFTVTEAALRQDANEDYQANNIVRLTRINMKSKVSEEYAIKIENVSQNNNNGNNGISDILSLSDNELLVMERAWISSVKKQVVKIYKVKLDNKTLVTNIDKLTINTVTLTKDLIYDFDDSEYKPDNLEVLSYGPIINGKKTLIVASDNNFSKFQKNQFYLYSIDSL